MTVFPNIFAGPKGEGAEDMIVVGGGVMPAEEVATLKKMGVKKVMLQDTPSQKVIDTLKKLSDERRTR